MWQAGRKRTQLAWCGPPAILSSRRAMRTAGSTEYPLDLGASASPDPALWDALNDLFLQQAKHSASTSRSSYVPWLARLCSCRCFARHHHHHHHNALSTWAKDWAE